MRVVILAPGTRGDVAPIGAVGAGLVADGHEVTVVANAEYASLVAASGCAHVSIEEQVAPAESMSGAQGVRAHLAQLRRYMWVAAEAALSASDGAEVVITNAISPYGHDIAEAFGVPSATALLQPAEPSVAYPPMIASARDLGARGNKVLGRLVRRVRAPYDPATEMVRKELGLPPQRPVKARVRRGSAESPVHHGISAAVLPRPTDWPDHLHLDGFWWPVEDPAWCPPEELATFLGDGSAPLLITLGSLEVGAEAVAAVNDVIARSKHRILVQGSAFGEIARDQPDRVLAVGDVPHGWLLPHTCGVLHQAGAGITAATLRAGVPSIPLPVHTDQPFWARRLHALGAATPPIPARRADSKSLRAAVEVLMASDDLRAGAMAARAALEGGDSTLPLRRWVARSDG